MKSSVIHPRSDSRKWPRSSEWSPSMRIQYEYLKMNYGYSRVGIRVTRNVVLKFVVDRRSNTVLHGSATVLSRAHYNV